MRRYGFHGTSHRYVAKGAAKALHRDLAELNMITCHLGNGASITAIKNGQCFDTSMGLTPLEGLVMGTRAGDHQHRDWQSHEITFQKSRIAVTLPRSDPLTLDLPPVRGP